jgi:predicted naringenin-chalcone synthase
MGNALFSDGAAALVCKSGMSDQPASARTGHVTKTVPYAAGESAKPHAMRLVATGSCLIPNSTDVMAWRIGDHGFDMYLSASVSAVIQQHLRSWIEQWLAKYDVSIKAIRSWAIHPGGPRILDAVESSLGLTPDDTADARGVLAEYGNMSSPTILFVLNRLQQRDAPMPCVALGFGPGLSIEAALFW